MTPSQIKYYGRAWGQTTRSCRWLMARGRLSPEAWHVASHAPGEGGALAGRVVQLAEHHAEENHRALTVEDLRRACTALASGRWCSTWDLTNREFDRLLCLFKILQNPDDLTAIMQWGNPEAGDRQRLIASIRSSHHEAYIVSISRDRWDTDDWSSLPTSDLRQLAMTLRARRAAKVRQELDPANAPF